MKFEVLKKSHLKRNIIIGVVAVLIISAIILNFTRAKYRTTQSIPLVNGTINYSLPDLNIVGLYIDGVEATELDSSKTYTLDTTQSTCTYKDGTEISDLSISYDSETGQLQISPFTTKGTKCTLYFEEYTPTISDTILANYPTQLTRSDFSLRVLNTTTGTIYYADTSKGRTYYFAGNPTDNWVQFGGFYWRIIRINEDGTLRLIYQGTEANITGVETYIGTNTFSINSSTYNNNAYVGYMYTVGSLRGTTTNSGVKYVLDQWYQNNLQSYADALDGNAGFCGDRTPSTSISSSNGQGGTGTTVTYYGALIRLHTNKAPTFECENSGDLYTTIGSEDGNKSLTYPIGLITADEVSYAGGVYGANNPSYYLYTGRDYWTMTPHEYSSSHAMVFEVDDAGWISTTTVNNTGRGVRPVVNLKADVQLTGSGTSTDPYVVS